MSRIGASRLATHRPNTLWFDLDALDERTAYGTHTDRPYSRTSALGPGKHLVRGNSFIARASGSGGFGVGGVGGWAGDTAMAWGGWAAASPYRGGGGGGGGGGSTTVRGVSTAPWRSETIGGRREAVSPARGESKQQQQQRQQQQQAKNQSISRLWSCYAPAAAQKRPAALALWATVAFRSAAAARNRPGRKAAAAGSGSAVAGDPRVSGAVGRSASCTPLGPW
ncbi:hypothetical protein PLESTB_000155700 [Pleodorina starrii]|uniref:Uncharacterized protein n=1 Tax=Pleodorina starrii TaxID=330485 RepID=A0A9W6EXW2_9CHLO|nr:hypothetical protein PLESTM_000454400 [Pleodorina starrii]GLC48854.1 hypothetical protein PLESTB_000155700 [Pleodorina starrii]